MSVSIRAYRPTDHSVCRSLWAELTEVQRELYDDPDLGGPDPSAGFEEYLTRLDLSGMWVAEHSEDGVIGLIGLILAGRAGEVYPVVVTQRHRSKGVGRALLAHVAEQARNRSLRQLQVMPESRNIAAIKVLHATGYDTLEAVRLTLDLTGRGRTDGDEIDLHGLRFRT
ncbi:MAG TPA: GNAT family N-acetyltransferase [Natronosporangium sp.]|nr:GNAT family N-acetyltransferase [Natronosporangium sp.]